MAQFDFPSSPSTNQTYTANGVSYKWDGVAWRRITTTGAQGATGSTGAQGAQGHQGATGAGAQGATGATGAQGATGSTGAQGATGSTGAQGAQGHQGNTGSTGAQGDAGSRSYTVTNSGSGAYVIDGSNNPTLNLLRGFTYTFNINASGHPFYIKTAQTTGTGNQYTSGVTGNGTQSGTLTFAVPYNAPSTLYYICQYHLAMKGTISISDVGPTGAQGAAGSQGSTGATGAQGAQGHQGLTGSGGSAGSTGAQGAQGHQGSTGSGGSTGAQGASGSTGSQGASGSGGGTGAQGAAGAQGATGSGGGTGAQGAAGAQGAQGHQGHQGHQGSTGNTGAQGSGGSTGAQGSAGTLATSGFKKVRTATIGSYSLSSGGSWTNAVSIGSFTPNSTNSVFLVNITIGNFVRVYGSGSATGQMRIRDATDNSNIDGVETLKNTADDSGAHTFTLIDLKGGTTARNYAVQLNSGNNNGRPRVDNVRMMVIEMDTTV